MVYVQFLRQLFISVTLSICGISEGFILGQMSGMINALSSNNTDITAISSNDLSWMASSINILCVLGVGLMGTITEILGRRKAITIANLSITACWVFMFFARTKMQLFIATVIQGMSYGGILIMFFITIGEYQPPKFRAQSITLTASVGSLIGSTLAHILSILFNWRYVALIGIIPSGLSATLPLFWVESPSWLAAKGKFKESEEAFNALHTTTPASANELRLLLASERMKRCEMSVRAPKVVLGKKIVMAAKQKYFWKIFLFTIALLTYKVASGRILFSTLAITVLQSITGTPDILLFTFLVDGLSIFGAVTSCFLLGRFKIRRLFIISGVIANVTLVMLGLCLYMFPENGRVLSWIKVTLLSFYFVIIMAGPYPIIDMLSSEIYPIEIKSFYLTVLGTFGGCLQFLSIKLLPNLLLIMGYHGVFFMNGTCIFLCILYMWFYMPETSGRSLQEIELYFKNGSFNCSNIVCKPEQTKLVLNINENVNLIGVKQ